MRVHVLAETKMSEFVCLYYTIYSHNFYSTVQCSAPDSHRRSFYINFYMGPGIGFTKDCGLRPLSILFVGYLTFLHSQLIILTGLCQLFRDPREHFACCYSQITVSVHLIIGSITTHNTTSQPASQQSFPRLCSTHL